WIRSRWRKARATPHPGSRPFRSKIAATSFRSIGRARFLRRRNTTRPSVSLRPSRRDDRPDNFANGDRSVKDLTGKVAAITGAGSGIGRALALALAGRGMHLALSDVNVAGLAQTAESARASGVAVTETKVDVADRAAVYAWAAQVAKDHGRVNMIVN